MRHRAFGGIAIMLALGACGGGSTVAAPGSVATVQATTNLQFSPGEADITVGGSVTWQFSSTAHNVTFSGSAAGTPANIPTTASASVARTFTTAGTFAYQCTIHPGMSGTVVVH